MQTETIKTPFGLTTIKKIGHGSLENPSILVLHGGPGYTHDYLVEPLKSLSSDHSLIFYDQPTLTTTKDHAENFTPEFICKHFKWLSHHLAKDKPLNIIAHSWGCLLFLASQADPSLSNEPSCEFSNCLLLNPTPVTSKKFAACSQNLMKRIAKLDKLKLLFWTLTRKEGSTIMKSLLPYYVMDHETIPQEEVALDTKTYLTLAQKLKKFDLSQSLPKLSNVKLVTCDHDFITLEQIDDLTKAYPNIETIENSGHFPFWEQPAEFNKILQETFAQKSNQQ
ncbi:MAG: alpha/beta fold hydrolase [Hyphomicrobiales bacterium]